MRVCLGGTFDIIHSGHRALLSEAVRIGDEIIIGLTSDKFASKKSKGIRNYSARWQNLSRLMKKYSIPYHIYKINDPYGPAVLSEDIDAIVVSPDTLFRAREINKIRKKKKLSPLKIYTIPILLALDGEEISSSRIRKGEIDSDGNMKRMLVTIASKNPSKINGTEKAFKKIFSGVNIKFLSLPPPMNIKPQPFNKEILNSALKRARFALKHRNSNFGVGIEAGLMTHVVNKEKKHLDVQFCAIADRGGRITLGHGTEFCYPEPVNLPPADSEDLRSSSPELGSRQIREAGGFVLEKFSRIKNVGKKEGAIGYLSSGVINMTELTYTAVLTALIPRMKRKMYGL